MVTYTVTAYTGGRPFAGTFNYVYIKLCGTKESEEKNINLSYFSAGSERKCEVECKASLGHLINVKLYCKSFWGLNMQWFCNKILVTTPEGDDIVFPCYRWIGCGEGLVVRHARATLALKDTSPALRKTELEMRQKAFRWSKYEEGMPHVIDCKSTSALPAEIQFSYTKDIKFFYTATKQVLLLKLKGLANCRESWKSISQLHTALCEYDNTTIEYVKEHWDDDEFFGSQFLNGINPMMIQRCSELPKNFPVTEEMVKDSLGGGSLKEKMKEGNIFLCDYKILDGLVGNEVGGRQQYLTAPLVLLYCDPSNKMLPIAIQLGQKAGNDNPIFLPTDSKYDWRLAKIYVRAAEFSVHEVDFHLLRTHLMAEVFTVATLRNFPTMHPLFKLLIPHTRYTLHINIKARNRLISENGAFSNISGIGGEALKELMRLATASLTYSNLCLPDNISERGLGKVPNYYYRDDGLKLWNVINKYVEGVLQHYYKSVDDVKNDTELQSWIREIFTEGFSKRKETGIPETFKAVKDLIKFVTMVIFTVTAQHAALNNGQYEFGSWMPHFPSALREPPPKKKGQTTSDTILQTLPDVGTTMNKMAVLKLLSTKSSDHYPLGYFPEDLHDNTGPVNHIKEFQNNLKNLSGEIEERNKKLELPYTFLDPINVENSVSL